MQTIKTFKTAFFTIVLRYAMLMWVLSIGLTSCEKHDFLDETTITGDVGPQAYWELSSNTVSAGANVSFTVQYYSTVSEIDYSQVWYNLKETIEKSVSCPWVTSFTYSTTSIITEEKRISQQIQDYPHSLAVWSDSLRAYTFDAEFPISGTLSPVTWLKPEQFDSTKMETYFGVGFMQHFKDSLYPLMQYEDFKKLILGLELMDDFTAFTDSTKDPNMGDDVYVKHFPKDADGKEVVPQEVTDLYNGVTFDQLINNTANSCYDVEYKRSYSMDAILRVYDVRGVYGTTTQKEIEIN